MIAWGYLVYAAIDFGSAARGGEGGAWWLLALASLGAVACLFIGMLLLARTLRELGVTSAPTVRGHRSTTQEKHGPAAVTESPLPESDPPPPSSRPS